MLSGIDVQQVHASETQELEIETEIAKHGLVLADLSGRECEIEPQWSSRDRFARSGFGLIFDDPDFPPKRRFFGLFCAKQPRRFIGIVWRRCSDVGATPEGWVLQVFGRKYCQKTTEFAQSLSKRLGIGISVELVQEYGRAENLRSKE